MGGLTAPAEKRDQVSGQVASVVSCAVDQAGLARVWSFLQVRLLAQERVGSAIQQMNTLSETVRALLTLTTRPTTRYSPAL